MQNHIVEKMQNFSDSFEDKKQFLSFLGVVNFVGVFIKNLAKHKKMFSPLLKKYARFIWTKEHTNGFNQLKEICYNLSKMSIPQYEDNLVLYINVSDHWWTVILTKLTSKREQPCRHCSELFSYAEATCWHINENCK